MSDDKPKAIPTPDFRHYEMEPGLIEASLHGSVVEVEWSDRQRGRFHAIWLRDNAADELSIDPHSHERLFEILDIPEDIKPVSVEVGLEAELIIDWGRQVTSYHPGWLRTYCYDLGVSDERRVAYETWKGDMAARLPRFKADDISNLADTRLEWLLAIRRYGIALVTESPTDSVAYIEWLESLLLIRDMNWGKHFDVIYQPEGEYISNKGVDIPPHNDAATRPHMPGIQIFHCISNTVQGGESYWVDGFHVAEALRRESPGDFELLSTVPWAMANRNTSSEYFCREPFITVDREGRLQTVRHTHWLREPLVADFDLIEPLYRAYRRYVEIAADESNRVSHRLQAGEVSFIDNPRIFHARGPYLTSQGERHMQVSHSEREEIDSAIALLQRSRAASEQ